MLKTKTIKMNGEDQIDQVCNEYEDRGWAVRQIVLNVAYGITYIVFEAEQVPGEYASVPAYAPIGVWKGAQVGVALPVPV